MSDLAIAQGIVQQIEASGRPRTWRRMTTILSAFGVYRLTPLVRRRIEVAFDGAGLSTEPSLSTVDRSDSVRLWMTEATVRKPPLPHNAPAPGVTFWERTDNVWQTTPALSGPGALLLVDVDFSSVHDPEQVRAILTATLPGLDDKTLTDLLDQDTKASFSPRRQGGAARRASLFLTTDDDGLPDLPQHAVLLTMGLVEFAVGKDWLLTVRYPSVRYVGGSPLGNNPPTATGKAYLGALLNYGLLEAASPGALALAVVEHAIYSLSQAKTRLDDLLEVWRTAARHPTSNHAVVVPDKAVLIDLQATVPLILRALEPLQHPTVKAFMGSEQQRQADAIHDQVDRDVDALRTLQAMIAAALAQADQARNERYQASLATLAGVLLAPALVASIFGASQLLQSSPLNLIWLFIAMVAAGVGTWLAIRSRFSRDRPLQP
jgi:hypothetical protein